MPVPTTMDEQDVADFMHRELSDVATALGFTATSLGSYEDAVYDVALALDVEDVADETDMAKLRAFAKVAAWKRALSAAAARYDMSDGTQALKRSQLVASIKDALATAETEASQYAAALAGYEVGVLRVTRTDDPYRQLDDEDRVL